MLQASSARSVSGVVESLEALRDLQYETHMGCMNTWVEGPGLEQLPCGAGTCQSQYMLLHCTNIIPSGLVYQVTQDFYHQEWDAPVEETPQTLKPQLASEAYLGQWGLRGVLWRGLQFTHGSRTKCP